MKTVRETLYVFSLSSRSNPKFFELNEEYLNNTANCPLHRGRALLEDPSDPPKFDARDFVSNAANWVFISVVISIVIAVAFLHLVRHHAFTLARATIGFQLAVPMILAMGLLLSGHLGQGLVVGGLAALTFLVFYIWRREIGVASKLLSVAGHGLAANTALIGLTVLLNVGAVALAIPPLMGVVLGLANGDVVPNPAREGSDSCIDAQTGATVLCCVWQPRPAAAGFMVVSALVAAWTMLTMNQIRVFVVSGTVAQWYYSPPGMLTTGNARRSLAQALTTSLGTNAFAGLVLAFTSAVKQQNSQDQQHGEISILGFLASCVASIFEYLTKFATVLAAISGEALLPAGRRVTNLLARNMLEAFATTIWFPSAVMSLASFTLSGLWGFAVWAGYRYLHGHSKELYPATNAVVLGVLTGVVTLFVLSFLSGVLLSVLDAVFVCFALDKDRHAVACSDMYEALLGVAQERGMLVEGPDGELGYAEHQNAPYAPPVVSR